MVTHGNMVTTQGNMVTQGKSPLLPTHGLQVRFTQILQHILVHMCVRMITQILKHLLVTHVFDTTCI